jgi:hypothetical protein
LYPFAFDDYVYALESESGSGLLDHMFAALLRLLFASYSKYNIKPGSLTLRNWQFYLVDALHSVSPTSELIANFRNRIERTSNMASLPEKSSGEDLLHYLLRRKSSF